MGQGTMPSPRIGLIRHFEVCHPFPKGWLTWQELVDWRGAYEQSDVRPGEIDLAGIPWSRCYASDLPRALLTAQAVFPGDIIQMPELREPRVGDFRTGRLRLPFSLWKQVLRVAWMTSHRSQRAARAAFMASIQQVVERVVATAAEDTLIVSHAGVMMFLRKELVRLGFAGPRFTIARNAQLYVFEKTRPTNGA